MTGKDQELYAWIEEVVERRLSVVELSVLCGKSYRQCQRILANVRRFGMAGVKHGNSGRVSKRRLPESAREIIRGLIRGKYQDFNLTHLREKLASEEHIFVARETLRQIAHSVGTIKITRRRRKKAYCLRPRMPREGMLVQFDGSEHPWFTRSQLIETHGVPQAYYLDEDGDQKLARDWLGIPAEPFGFSKNPRIYFGAPSLQRSSFLLVPGQNQISVKMKEL